MENRIMTPTRLLAACALLTLVTASCGRSPLRGSGADGQPADLAWTPVDAAQPDLPMAAEQGLADGPPVMDLQPSLEAAAPDLALDLGPKPDLPPRPALVVKKFTAKKNGADIDYSYEVCNVGQVTPKAWSYRSDIYTKGLLAPLPMVTGDYHKNHSGLAPGKCVKVSKTQKSAPVGIYQAWVQVDTTNAVKESNEKNNVAGPRLFTVSPPSGCTSLCAFAVPCGKFGLVEFGKCLTWCKNMSTTQRTCAQAAANKLSCADLNKCSLPAKPNIPGPLTCINVCNYLTGTCKLIPKGNELVCVAGCFILPESKKQCALNMMAKKLCISMMACLL